LVAEDNATNQRVAQLVLESGGYRPVIVSSGEAALDALESGEYDLALFDLSMPGVSGLEALRLYRFSAAKPVPILILSANVTSEVISECALAGAAEFVAKPIRPATLLEAIERHLPAADGPLVHVSATHAASEPRPVLTVVQPAAIDERVLADLDRLSSDPTFIGRLLAGFRSDAERLVSEISEALATRNYEAVKDAAHALKGGAGSVGATHLTTIATRLEKANHETLRSKAFEWTDDLHRAAAEALSILDRHVVIHEQQVGG
jgi:two-component system sensor histidine kinase RpfC